MSSQVKDALRLLGTRRVEAALVAILLERGPIGTAEILERTGLRQPEVSVGMAQLRKRGWIRSEPVPREGKGRPMHEYHLDLPAKKIVEHYRDLGRKQLASIEKALETIKV